MGGKKRGDHTNPAQFSSADKSRGHQNCTAVDKHVIFTFSYMKC